MPKDRSSFFYRNGLGITMLAYMLIFLIAQFITGWHTYNEELLEEGQAQITAGAYLYSGHFIQATFENQKHIRTPHGR